MQNEKPSEKPPQEGSVVQERLNWQVAWRDDTKVGQALYAGETIEEMHQLSDAGLLDEFFVFLKELGMLEAFGGAGWKQSAHSSKLPGVRQGQTDAQSEGQRAKRTSDARVLRVWVESAGPD